MNTTKPTTEMVRACCELCGYEHIPDVDLYDVPESPEGHIGPSESACEPYELAWLAVQVLAKMRTIECVEDYSNHKKSYCVCGMGFDKDKPAWEWPEIEHDGTAASWAYAVLKAGAEIQERRV